MRTREINKKVLALENFLEKSDAPLEVQEAFAFLNKQLDSFKLENVALAHSNIKVSDTVVKLEEKSEALTEAQKAKDRFIECISHEIRTPLHYIINFADLGKVKSEQDSNVAHVQEYFDSIINSGYKLLAMVEDLINLSDMASGHYKIYRHLDDIRSLIKQTALKYQREFDHNKITLTLELPEKPIFIQMDAQKIAKALSSLIENSIKFSQHNDKVNISLKEHETSIEILVQDTGLGIPENELESIFETFTQSTRTIIVNRGNGLGLALCQKIIQAHDGQCYARNNSESGCLFSIKLPKPTPENINE